MTEYDGLESYVSDQLKHDQMDWVPQMRALSLSDIHSQENMFLKKLDDVLQELAELGEAINQDN